MNSVCIATYNGEGYIVEQLQSILEQLKEDDEVIVSDDESTDHTLTVITSIGDKRIKIILNHCHGVQGNFENALRHSIGDIIFLSDQDDMWLPGKYERCIEELKQVDLVCTNSMLTDENLHIVNPNFFSLYHSGAGVLKNSLNSTYYGSCMAFRRSLLDYALPFPPAKEIGHDMWLGLVAEMTGKVRFIDTPYLLYRRHIGTSTNTIGLWKRSSRPLWKKIWSRVIILFYVCKFKIRHAR